MESEILQTINYMWDSNANVWIATSESVPGLVLEDASYDDLIERVKTAVPELLELNSLPGESISA